MKYKIIIAIIYIISADQKFDALSNKIWSVLFVVNKYDLFLDQVQNIIKQNFVNVKIVENFTQIDEKINFWVKNCKYLAVVIWDHKEKKEINRHFAQELGQNIAKIDKKIDVLCLDFCYSANFEIIINIMHQVDFVIANQDRQFMDGLCYDMLFETSLNKQNQQKSCKEVAQEIVLQTCNKYIRTDQFNLINIVAIDCQKISLLRPFINKLESFKSNSIDLFNQIEKNFHNSFLTNFLINNIIIAQAKTGNYLSSSGISI